MSAPPTRSRFSWRFAALVLASMACLVSGSAEATSAQEDSLKPIYWQQRLFFIPYQANRQDESVRSVAKVQLLMSRDGTSNWQVLEQAEMNVQGFSYHAPEDGEYWFALRHLDHRGQPWPNAAVRPQMRIVVDTELPKLELSGALNATGAIVVRYEARDTSLRPETLVIEVRTSGGQWVPLNPGPPDVSHADRTVGRVEWNPPFGASTIEVRGSIADGSGQRAQATATVPLSGPSLLRNDPTIAQKPTHGESAGSLLPRSPLADPFRSISSFPTQDWPANNHLPAKSGGSGELLNPFVSPRTSAEPPASNPYATANTTGPSNRTPTQAFTGGSAVSPEGWSVPATSASSSEARVVNSRTFDVDYDLESIGPWGVAKVELWGTHDGGRTWQSFGVDNDNRSPVRATVPTAGIYGFRILVDGANGAASPRPRHGDKPDLVVAVDLDPPTAELLSAELGQRNLTGHLVVRWAVEDTNLESRPISLFYSTLPNGPWSTIAAGLENTGGYTWRLERHVPDRFYLRLEARDVAGNLATHQTSSPIMLQRPQPTGRLRGVRPVQEGQRRYNTAENNR